MPVHLEIDHDRRLLIATARGALNLPDVTDYFARLISGATLSYRKIFDGRDAWLDLSQDHVGVLAQSVRAMASRGPRGPVAIVTTTPRGVAGAHLFMRIPAADRPSQLFPTLDAARAWLEADFVSSTDPSNRRDRIADAMSSPSKPVLTPSMARLQAHKARRLAFEMLSLDDRNKLLSYAREMDEWAVQLETAAAAATDAGDNVALFPAGRSP